MTQENDTVLVCYDCIGDSFLADEVKEKGNRGLCSYCGKKRKALTLEKLAERIHEVLQEHFRLSFNETLWERSGYPVIDLIADMAGLDEEVADDVRALLSKPYEYEAMTDGAENPYDSDAHITRSLAPMSGVSATHGKRFVVRSFPMRDSSASLLNPR